MTTAGMTSIRRAVKSAHAGLLRLTADLNTNADHLYDFGQGTRDLHPDTIAKLVDIIWSGTFRYDANTDTLVNVKTREPIGIGVMPDRPVTEPEWYPDPCEKVDLPVLKQEPARDTARRVGAFLKGALVGAALK